MGSGSFVGTPTGPGSLRGCPSGLCWWDEGWDTGRRPWGTSQLAHPCVSSSFSVQLLLVSAAGVPQELQLHQPEPS